MFKIDQSPTTKKNKAWTLFGATFILGLPLPVRYHSSSASHAHSRSRSASHREIPLAPPCGRAVILAVRASSIVASNPRRPRPDPSTIPSRDDHALRQPLLLSGGSFSPRRAPSPPAAAPPFAMNATCGSHSSLQQRRPWHERAPTWQPHHGWPPDVAAAQIHGAGRRSSRRRGPSSLSSSSLTLPRRLECRVETRWWHQF